MSELSFQALATDVPTRFRAFYGRIIDNMPLLLTGKDAEGKTVDIPRTPMTPKELLYERVHGTHEGDRTLLRNNYVHTVCAVIGDPAESGEVLIARYDDAIVQALIDSLNPQTTLQQGALPVPLDPYQTIKKNALVIPPTAARNIHKDYYSEAKTREAFWEYVAEGDPRLVKDTLALVQDKTSGGTMNDRMGLWLPTTLGLRLLGVDSVGDDDSDAGGDFLDDDNCRLVGVVPREKNLETTVEKTFHPTTKSRHSFCI